MAAAALPQQQQQQAEEEGKPPSPTTTTMMPHIVDDAWDYKGRPAVRSSSGGWLSAAMILVVELNERLTTLGVAVNLVPYLTGTMHVGSAASANAVTNFLGASFMLCLLGGFVADTCLGRYLTIAISTAVQAAGMAVLTVSTAAPGLRPPPGIPATGAQVGVLNLGLYLTALGTGGLKSSVSGFGSDQFDDASSGDEAVVTKFFGWFFFLISLGSLLGVTVLVYVQDRLGRPWGYGACVVAIIAGLLVFLAGTARYRFKKLVGSPLAQIAAVTMAAWRNCALPMPKDPTDLYDIDRAKAAGEDVKGKQKLPRTKQCRFLERAAIVSSSWAACTLTDVEEVKQVVRMLPVWATTIPFWTVYAQMTTFSVAQADVMDRRLLSTTSSFQIPAGSLTVFLVASILVSVPAYDRLLLPLARRLTANPRAGLSPLQRISVGLLLSALAMVTAALVERHRRDASSGAAPATSVFLLVPQFFLVGAGEAFAYVGQLDFFLRECPRGMKTMSTGLFLSTLALGCFLSTAIVTAVHAATTWLTDDLDRGRLDSFYWLLAAISAANLLAFVAVARGYVYNQDKQNLADDDDDGGVVVHA
ncbi:unnamed protein product [Urochloa decumbens]|uniref:Uncharacterized protein n=1 Tax=Urochloa decumbens TaxID=240449 RepID=A0ABC8ZZK5_9POAL